jgi:cytochrome P450/nitrite reductase/ring-hydroxylating ferredoxin subunit
MSTPRWSRVGREGDFAGEGPYVASADGVDLVLVRGSNGLKAYDGRCPHQGALLGEGELDGDVLVCRNHRWRFDVETGERRAGPGDPKCLVACPVRTESGNVLVDTSAVVKTGVVKGARRIADLPGPPSLPFIGSAHLLDPAAFHLKLEEWSRSYGTPLAYRLGSLQMVVFGDVDAFMPVLRERPEMFRRASNIAPIFRELGADGVFSAEGQAWRVQRRLSMEALSHRHLKSFYPSLATVAGRLQRRWARAAERGLVLDMSDELKRFTVDVTTQLVFGYDIDTLQQEGDVIQRKLELIFPTLNRRVFALAPWWRFLRTPTDRRVDRAVHELHEWIAGLVADVRAKLAADPARAESPANFLEAMVVARDEEGRPFDDETIFGNAMTMLLAGEDTTAYTLAWAVHHLADAPDVVQQLRADLASVLGDARIPATIEVANRLAFAGAVANESMRLRPVAPLNFNEACVDTTVGDVFIPKGTVVVAMTRLSATARAHFGDPEVFRPARWVDPAATGGAHNPGAHQPFGSGPRICPGRTLALLEMKLVLATLYASFDVERVGASSDVRELLAFTMMPSAVKVRLRARGASAGTQ